MRNCEIINEVFYKGKTYFEVVTKNSNKHFYFRKFSDDDIKVVSKEEFDKALGSNGKSLKNQIASKLILPVILSGMITSSLTGCGKSNENNAEPTKVEVNQDLIDAIKSGKEFRLEEDGSITYIDNTKPKDYEKTIKLEELEKCGVELEKVADGSMYYGDASIYMIKKMEIKKLPKNILFEGLQYDYNRVDSVDLNTNVTWDDCIALIDSKDFKEEYKTILKNAVENYKNLDLDNAIPILYENIRSSKFVMDKTHPAAMFDAQGHRLVFGSINVGEDKELYNQMVQLKELGFYTDEDCELLLEQHIYIGTHEPGHMTSSYYDPKTGDSYNTYDYYIAVDNQTKEVLDIIQMGKFAGEGYADYLTYEGTKRKPCKMYGYSVNQCFYLACIDVLGINSLDELRTLNTEKLIEKLGEFGFESPFDWAMIFERIVTLDYNALYNMEANNIDLTEALITFLDEYYSIQKNKGISDEEIEKSISNIIDTIGKRVTTTENNGEKTVQATAGFTTISLDTVEQYYESYDPNEYYLK